MIVFSVNQLKASASSDRAWDGASEFDTEKDKTKFRQYEEACDRVKNFYKEQHGEIFTCASFFASNTDCLRPLEKQTMDFNLKIRANFKKTVRARMGKSKQLCVSPGWWLMEFQAYGRRWRC